MQLQQEHLIRLCHMTTRYAQHILILFNFRRPLLFLGLSGPAPTSAACKISRFGMFWMGWNPIQPQDRVLGSFFSITQPHIQRSVFSPFPHSLPTYPLPPAFPFLPFSPLIISYLCFSVPPSFLPFSPLIISLPLLFGSSLFPSLFPTHNFFFLFWDLFFL